MSTWSASAENRRPEPGLCRSTSALTMSGMSCLLAFNDGEAAPRHRLVVDGAHQLELAATRRTGDEQRQRRRTDSTSLVHDRLPPTGPAYEPNALMLGLGGRGRHGRVPLGSRTDLHQRAVHHPTIDERPAVADDDAVVRSTELHLLRLLIGYHSGDVFPQNGELVGIKGAGGGRGGDHGPLVDGDDRATGLALASEEGGEQLALGSTGVLGETLLDRRSSLQDDRRHQPICVLAWAHECHHAVEPTGDRIANWRPAA